MALAICGIVAVAFAASGLLTWQVMHRDARQLQGIRIESIVSILKETRQLAGWQGLYAAVDQISNPTLPDTPTIAILDPDGTVIAKDPLPFDPPRGVVGRAGRRTAGDRLPRDPHRPRPDDP